MATMEIPSNPHRYVEDEQPKSKGPRDWGPTVYSLVRDFLIDVLGSLVGILFIIAVCALVITSGTCFLDVFGSKVLREPTFGLLLRASVDAFHAWLLFIVAYVVGGIFHRLDPKRPDRKSMEKALRGMTHEELKHFEVQTEVSEMKSRRWRIRIRFLTLLDHLLSRPNKALGRVEVANISSSIGAHFPYSHIKAYLQSRQLTHLAEMIKWESGKNWTGCSKMFINILKIRMQWVAPRKCGELVRNEAHCRMMSSIWYAANAVFTVFCVSALPVLAAVWRLHPNLESLNAAQQCPSPGDAQTCFAISDAQKCLYLAQCYHDVAVYLAVASFAFLSALWLKRHVEDRFHYQRVKEVVYVLETAFCLANSGHPEILENLPEPPKSEKKDEKALPGGPMNPPPIRH
jgi:hypothetical protein